MADKKERDTFTQYEIGVALNNAVTVAGRSTIVIGQADTRKRRIREYVEELSKILCEEIEDGSLKAEELVHILTVSALVVHCSKVMKTTKLPQFEDFAKRRLEDDKELDEKNRHDE